jgi:hypothetical protein
VRCDGHGSTARCILTPLSTGNDAAHPISNVNKEQYVDAGEWKGKTWVCDIPGCHWSKKMPSDLSEYNTRYHFGRIRKHLNEEHSAWRWPNRFPCQHCKTSFLTMMSWTGHVRGCLEWSGGGGQYGYIVPSPEAWVD